MACACKVENFATAVRVREVSPDVVVPHSKVSQIIDILGLVCQTELSSSAREKVDSLLLLCISLCSTGTLTICPLVLVGTNYHLAFKFQISQLLFKTSISSSRYPVKVTNLLRKHLFVNKIFTTVFKGMSFCPMKIDLITVLWAFSVPSSIPTQWIPKPTCTNINKYHENLIKSSRNY